MKGLLGFGLLGGLIALIGNMRNSSSGVAATVQPGQLPVSPELNLDIPDPVAYAQPIQLSKITEPATTPSIYQDNWHYEGLGARGEPWYHDTTGGGLYTTIEPPKATPTPGVIDQMSADYGPYSFYDIYPSGPGGGPSNLWSLNPLQLDAARRDYEAAIDPNRTPGNSEEYLTPPPQNLDYPY
jgi:hypothetical protein